MLDRVALKGVRGFGRHGVLPEEQVLGQPFYVDVHLSLDTRPAAKSDDVADTVNYADIATSVVALVEGEPVRLIETLADRIAAECLTRPRVESVEVTVHKPGAPVTVPFDDVSVTITRSRS